MPLMQYSGELHVISQVAYAEGSQEDFVLSLMRLSRKEDGARGVVVFLDRESAETKLTAGSPDCRAISFIGPEEVAKLIKTLIWWATRFEAEFELKDKYIVMASGENLLWVSVSNFLDSMAKFM